MNESLRDHLAIEIMGYEFRDTLTGGFWVIDSDRSEIQWEDWKPDENIEQAMMCLYKFGAWSVRRELLGNYIVTIDSPKKAKAEGTAIGFLMAICLACAKATRWK